MIAMLCLASGVLHDGSPRQTIPDLVLAHGRVIDPESGLDAVATWASPRAKSWPCPQRRYRARRPLTCVAWWSPLAASICIPTAKNCPEPGCRRATASPPIWSWKRGHADSRPLRSALAKEGRPINYGASVSWAVARIVAIHKLKPQGPRISWKKVFYLPTGPRLATQEQEDQILDLIDQGLKEGGVGVGLLAGYCAGVRQEGELPHPPARRKV